MNKTGKKSPKASQESSGLEILTELLAAIADRADASSASSYTAKLLAGAPHLPAKKFGEEAIELALAAVGTDKAAITAEAADVLYHLFVVLQASGVTLRDVCAVLAKRQGVSGLAEKASRQK